MQQLADDALGELLDPLGGGPVDAGHAPQRALHLLAADGLCLAHQRADRRARGVALGDDGDGPRHLGLDDRGRLGKRGPLLGAGTGDPPPTASTSMRVTPGIDGRLSLDVARHRDVDDRQRAVAAPVLHDGHVGDAEHRVGAVGAADHHLDSSAIAIGSVTASASPVSRDASATAESPPREEIISRAPASCSRAAPARSWCRRRAPATPSRAGHPRPPGPPRAAASAIDPERLPIDVSVRTRLPADTARRIT